MILKKAFENHFHSQWGAREDFRLKETHEEKNSLKNKL